MDKWECEVCGYVYDPSEGDSDGGIAPGTAFEDLPDDWVCPVCGAGKDEFKKLQHDAKMICFTNSGGYDPPEFIFEPVPGPVLIV